MYVLSWCFRWKYGFFSRGVLSKTLNSIIGRDVSLWRLGFDRSSRLVLTAGWYDIVVAGLLMA